MDKVVPFDTYNFLHGHIHVSINIMEAFVSLCVKDIAICQYAIGEVA